MTATDAAPAPGGGGGGGSGGGQDSPQASDSSSPAGAAGAAGDEQVQRMLDEATSPPAAAGAKPAAVHVDAAADAAPEAEVKEQPVVDPALLERASASAIVKRYSQQLRDAERLHLELAQQQRRQQQLLKEQEEAQRELKEERDKLERIDTLARELRKKREQTLEGVKQADRDEQSQRTALSKKFQTTIGDITARMETEAEEQWTVAQRNKQLKSRLSIMEQQVDLKSQQYEQLIKTRDVELRLADAKCEHLREMERSDTLRSDAQSKQLGTEQVKEVELKKQLDALKARFDELQTTIIKSNDVFKGYKGEMQKMTKRSKALDNDRAAALRRYGTKKKATDDIRAEVESQEARLEQFNRAGETIQALTSRLRQEKEDYEAWKRECPEEYSEALAGLAPEVAAAAAAAAAVASGGGGGGGGRKKKK